MSIKDTLHAASSMAVILLIGSVLGAAGGYAVALKGSPFNVELTNSTVAMAQPGYPCAENSAGLMRCTFTDGNTTWVCHAESGLYSHKDETTAEGCDAK